MALTTAQLATLKAAILADPVLAAMSPTTDGAADIADAYNLPASPAWIVWRTSLDLNEVMENGMDWTRCDNLSVGKARIWDWMRQLARVNPSKLNIRTGIDAVWVGTQADLDVRAMVYTHCKRAATRIEKLFSTGTGTTAVPATMAFEGNISYQDVQAARNS
jgi:hypothetical protein